MLGLAVDLQGTWLSHHCTSIGGSIAHGGQKWHPWSTLATIDLKINGTHGRHLYKALCWSNFMLVPNPNCNTKFWFEVAMQNLSESLSPKFSRGPVQNLDQALDPKFGPDPRTKIWTPPPSRIWTEPSIQNWTGPPDQNLDVKNLDLGCSLNFGSRAWSKFWVEGLIQVLDWRPDPNLVEGSV